MPNRFELRRSNRNLVYRTLLRKEGMSKQEIAYAVNLSIPTVAQNLRELERKGLVTTTGALQSTGGRRAQGFQCVRNARYAIGIDITQNHMTIAVVNIASEIVCISERKVFHFADKRACYEEIRKKTGDLLHENGIEEDRILGIGVSLPCIVDREKNEVTYSKIIDAPRDVREKFAGVFSQNIEIYNDANAAGYAEMHERSVMEEESRMLIYLMLSNSVGGAMIQSTAGSIFIYPGDHCRSGELGHMRIVPNGKKCFCGQKGCANVYCSAKNLSDYTDGRLQEFFRQMEEGNTKYREVFREYLKYLAITVVNLRMLYDCEIVLGGYAGAEMEKYMDEIRRMVSELNPYEDDGSYVTPCLYKHEASAVGAAFDFIERFVENI